MTPHSSYPTVKMYVRKNHPSYFFEWMCSGCGYMNNKEIEDTTDLSPLAVGRKVDLPLSCGNCWTLDKTQIQINIIHTSPTTVMEEDK